MDNYFLSIIEKLHLEDIEVLNLLTKQESISRFSARSKKSIYKESSLSEAKFRKIICRLEAMNFIELVSGNKEHLLFVTGYGQGVIQCLYERGNI